MTTKLKGQLHKRQLHNQQPNCTVGEASWPLTVLDVGTTSTRSPSCRAGKMIRMAIGTTKAACEERRTTCAQGWMHVLQCLC